MVGPFGFWSTKSIEFKTQKRSVFLSYYKQAESQILPEFRSHIFSFSPTNKAFKSATETSTLPRTFFFIFLKYFHSLPQILIVDTIWYSAIGWDTRDSN